MFKKITKQKKIAMSINKIFLRRSKTSVMIWIIRKIKEQLLIDLKLVWSIYIYITREV